MRVPPDCENSRDGGLLFVASLQETMSQETVVRILAVEEDAVKIHDEAQHRAAGLIAEAEKAGARVYAQRMAQAQQQAGRIIAAGQEKAEAERAWVLAHAVSEAQRLDASAAKNLPRAVEFVLTRITGQP